MTEVKFRSDIKVELINTPLPESFIAEAARTSISSTFDNIGAATEPRDVGLIRRLLHDGHWTPFEYIDIVVRVELPIFVHNQLVKHRISTINTQSGRYSTFEPVFYIPDKGRPLFQSGKAIDYTMHTASNANEHYSQDVFLEGLQGQCIAWAEQYEFDMEGTPIAREVARMGMPLNTYTSCIVKMNLRSWLNFINLRHYDPSRGFNSHAQYEIGLMAEEVIEILEEHFPVTMQKFFELKVGEQRKKMYFDKLDELYPGTLDALFDSEITNEQAFSHISSILSRESE